MAAGSELLELVKLAAASALGCREDIDVHAALVGHEAEPMIALRQAWAWILQRPGAI